MTDPWLPPGAARPVGVLPHLPQHAPQQPFAQPHPQPFGLSAPPPAAAPRRGNGLAITALVVAVLALLGVIGLALVVTGPGLATGLGHAVDTMDGEYALEGTLPQASPGRAYSATEIQVEVERVLEADWSTFEELECLPLPAFAVGEVTTCSGVVDDYDTDIDLVVDDEVGHFTLIQYW